jgi:hypothetical protein
VSRAFSERLGAGALLGAPVELAAWENERHRPCRSYLQNVVVDGAVTSASAALCRDGDGAWRLSAAEPPPAALPRRGDHCPAPGTIIETSLGGWLQFTGEAGEQCRYRMRSGATSSRYALLVEGGSDFVRQGGERLRALWPLHVGAQRWFESDAVGSTGVPGSWYETYSVVRRETVTVPAGTFDTYVIEWEESGREGNTYRATNTYWYAPNVGYFVKFEADKVPYNELRDWQATRVFVPAATALEAQHAAPAGDFASPAR